MDVSSLTHSSHPALCLLQGWCWDGVRTRFSPWPVLPYAPSQEKKKSENSISAPLSPQKSIPLPTTHMSYGCSDCSQVHNTFHGLISLHASLLLQDQGDVTLQINNNEWDYMTHSPLSISSALCHRTLWAELQPRLSNMKLQDISLGRPVIAMNSLVTHKSFPPRHATRKPLAVRCCHPWSSAGIN